METEFWMIEEGLQVNMYPDGLMATRKRSQTGKPLILMMYTDLGLKNSPPYTTDLQRKWINAYRKLRYSNGRPKENYCNPKKKNSKEPPPQNYRPITCLLIMWKMLTAQIKKIYHSLISHRIFPEEQKGCCKRTKGTEELLYIHQDILNESNTRRKNLAMAWIDYKKAYNIVPQSWMLHCFKM